MNDQIILTEFIEQINYCLSLKFKEKWRYRFSTHFVSIFQDKVLNSMETQRPLKMSTLMSAYTKKHKYNSIEVKEFFKAIEIEEYYPLIYEDKKYIEQKPYLFSAC
jgi:hypothetical protein|tara:strand:- start:120 stop:437 length:318 start_codon:yes stop_codon:yes gene_type:complete